MAEDDEMTINEIRDKYIKDSKFKAEVDEALGVKKLPLSEIRAAVLCPKCEHEMPRVTHGAKDIYQCVSAACDYRRWHTKTGELAYPLPSDKKTD